MKSSSRLPRHDDICHLVDFLPITRRPRRLSVSCTHDSSANKVPSAVKAHRPSQRKSNREPRIVCAAKKKVNLLSSKFPSSGRLNGAIDRKLHPAWLTSRCWVVALTTVHLRINTNMLSFQHFSADMWIVAVDAEAAVWAERWCSSARDAGRGSGGSIQAVWPRIGRDAPGDIQGGAREVQHPRRPAAAASAQAGRSSRPQRKVQMFFLYLIVLFLKQSHGEDPGCGGFAQLRQIARDDLDREFWSITCMLSTHPAIANGHFNVPGPEQMWSVIVWCQNGSQCQCGMVGRMSR